MSEAADAVSGFAPGTRLAGRYVLQTELGKGGIGAVYRARDESAGRDVACKVLLAKSSREMQALFEREYHTLASLKLGDRYCRIVMLATARGGTPQVVGAAVIELEPDAPLNLAADVLAASSEAVWELVSAPSAASESAAK